MPKKAFGTTAAALGSSSTKTTRGVQLKAKASNAGIVYVGYDSGVTDGDTDATDGMELTAGESYLVPPNKCSSLASIFIIASEADQVVFYDVL